MNLLDNLLKALQLNDEDELEFEDEWVDDDDDVEEEKPKRAFRNKKEPKTEVKKEIKEPVKEKPIQNNPKITPITKTQRKQVTMTNMEVCVIKPTGMEDEIEITNTLLNGKTVLINVEGLSVEIAQRIIDFTSGASYAMQGNLQKISNYIFLATPNGVDISGDINNILGSLNEDSSGFHF